MSRNAFLVLYLIIGTVALFFTVQRIANGELLRALISGTIAGYSLYRVYTISRLPR